MIDDPTSKFPLKCVVCGKEGNFEPLPNYCSSRCFNLSETELICCTLCNSTEDVEEVLMGEDAYHICKKCKDSEKEQLLRNRMRYTQMQSLVGSVCKVHKDMMDNCFEDDREGCKAQTVDDVYPMPKED